MQNPQGQRPPYQQPPYQQQYQQPYQQQQYQQPYQQQYQQSCPPQYGQPQGTTQNNIYVNTDGNGKNGMGIAGFVLALCAFLFCWIPVLNVILWLLGVIFSLIGVFRQPRGFAIAGLVISFIGIIISLIMGAAILAAL